MTDSPQISFTPKARRSRTGASIFGALLLLTMGVSLAGYATHEYTTGSPVKNDGQKTTGIVTGFEVTAAGTHALVSFTASDAQTAKSQKHFTTEQPNMIGKSVTVYYYEDQPSVTFIDGVDELVVPWELYGGAGGFLIAGVALGALAPGRRVIDSNGTRVRRSKNERIYAADDERRRQLYTDPATGQEIARPVTGLQTDKTKPTEMDDAARRRIDEMRFGPL